MHTNNILTVTIIGLLAVMSPGPDYGLEISLIVLSWFSLLATVLSVEKVKGVFERFSKWLERITGAILIMLGVKLALYRK